MSITETKKTALGLLARREHSTQELSKKLLQRGFLAIEIDEGLKSLIEKNLQSDERFAEMLVKSRANHGYGPIRIQNELKQNGVSDDIIRLTLFESGYDWCQIAREVHQKKYPGSLPKDYLDRAKQMRFLQYRGFTSEQIQAAIHCDEELPS